MANAGKQLPKCKYGSLCYRTNADHRMNYWHPEHLSNTRTNVADEHLPGAYGQETVTINVMDEEIEDAPEGDRRRHALEGVKTEEINKFGSRDATLRDALPNVPESAKKADAGVLLLLVGVPGSGKSTFCSKLMSNAAQPWTRICQDIIAKGKRGTKKECLKHTERVLAQKGSVVIDRCNIDRGQRLEFLQLAARFGVESHGVVLDLPASVCIQRASNRIGHEGGVNGANAGSLINRFVSTRQLPILSEGFSRIAFCRTDMDVEKAVQHYRELLPSQHLESGVFGASLNKSKNALQSVLEKGKDRQDRRNNIDPKDHQVGKAREGLQQVQVVGGREKSELMPEAWPSCRSEACNSSDLANSGIEGKGTSTLAFPSISTSDFQFDHEKASSVLVEAVAKFLMAEDSKMRLLLVDLTNSHMLSLVRRKAQEKGLDSNRFLTYVGDITKLRTSHGPACNIIANAANWRLKAGGGGVNAAIYSAAGPDFECATKKVAQTISPGTSVVVQLPESSPLCINEGVTHVIHVLGPNMNPQRPNSLSGDYFEGCRILQSSYASLFQNFSSIVKSSRVVEISSKVEASNAVDSSNKVEANGETIVGTSTQKKPSRNAFTVLMQASKRNRELQGINPKRDKVRVTEEVLARTSRGTDKAVHPLELDTSPSCRPETFNLQNQPHSNPCRTSTGICPNAVAQKEETDTTNQEGLTTAEGNQQCSTSNGKTWNDWALALYEIAIHPEQHTDVVLQITDDAVVLHDMYPKAKEHLLVVTRRPALDNLDSVRKDHLPVLRHMHSLGVEWAAHYLMADPSLTFRLGYHLVSSMRQVHLHLISQDFDSASLKNKKHWNSFTTPFFRDSLDLLDQLERHGQVQNSAEDAERLLDLELRCHRCRSAHPNPSRLKQHIFKCRRPFANSAFLITIESLPL